MTKSIGGVQSISLFSSFKQVLGSYSANMLIPGKMGEIVRIPWMKKYKMKTPALILVLIEKIFDLLSIFVILFLTLIIYHYLNSDTPTILTVICYLLGLGLSIVGLMYAFRQLFFNWIEQRFKWVFDKKSEDFFYYKLRTAILLINKDIKWYAIFSILLWIVQGLEFYAIFIMFDVYPAFVDLFAGTFLALLAGAIPISIAGLGPRDAVIVSFFQNYATVEILAGIGIMSLFRILFISLIGLPLFFMQSKE